MINHIMSIHKHHITIACHCQWHISIIHIPDIPYWWTLLAVMLWLFPYSSSHHNIITFHHAIISILYMTTIHAHHACVVSCMSLGNQQRRSRQWHFWRSIDSSCFITASRRSRLLSIQSLIDNIALIIDCWLQWMGNNVAVQSLATHPQLDEFLAALRVTPTPSGQKKEPGEYMTLITHPSFQTPTHTHRWYIVMVLMVCIMVIAQRNQILLWRTTEDGLTFQPCELWAGLELSSADCLLLLHMQVWYSYHHMIYHTIEWYDNVWCVNMLNC